MVLSLGKLNHCGEVEVMYPTVKNIKANDDYTLMIEFDNGEQGILDMKPHLDFGVFERLKDPEKFKKVKIVFDTVEWEAGLDLDPEFVYRNCRKYKMTGSS